MKSKKSKNFPFFPENKKNNPVNFTAYVNEIKPDTYTQTKKVDWTDKNAEFNSIGNAKVLC